ncbi:NHL repeat-containing protein [Mucilaginibacter sp. P19]|uniref:NHL repeat-containing protein n=1 Tax=Mucilaginibacter gossypii TaxID=551996 RepID=A0A1G7Z8C9_9SPHI|nr:NHL repeat-containing protein [Mucilaginibacter gossypii]SDH05003.1 NHL repeat-containing protein [Mucilaginibacter gossypii]
MNNKRFVPALLLIAISTSVALFSCSKDKPAPATDDNPKLENLPGHTYTLAGNGTYGYVDGLRANAALNNPNGVAVDAAGNLYVTDQGNNAIRKITSEGIVTTLAGGTGDGLVNGPAKLAKFNNPIGIALDSKGNTYVTDFGNNVIRKIATDGTVSTFAGSGVIGFNDGKGPLATFNGPAGIAIDHADNLYITDNHNIIRKITPSQDVTTFAGNVHSGPGFADGTGSEANFRLPEGLAIDGADNIYVADYSNNMIRKITPAAVVTTVTGKLAPGSDNGASTSATFNGPLGVAVDKNGNIYVTDNLSLIRKIAASGEVTTFAGTKERGFYDGANLQAKFNDPHGIAVDASGNIYVGDEQNARIRKIIPPAK